MRCWILLLVKRIAPFVQINSTQQGIFKTMATPTGDIALI